MSFGSNLSAQNEYSHAVEGANYRPISSMAVLCFCLALLSGLAFMSSAFWLLPPIVLVMSIFTSSSLEQARVEYGGQLLAKLAVFLSLAFLIAAPTRYFLERYIIVSDAKRVAEEFVDNILLNHVKAAYIPTRQPVERIGLENEPDEIVKRGGAKYRQFLTEQHVSRLRGRLKDAQVTYEGVLNYGFEQGAYYVLLKYSIQLDDKDYTPGVVAGLLGENVNSKPYVRAIDYRLDLRGGSAPGGEWKGRQWWVKMVNARELAQ